MLFTDGHSSHATKRACNRTAGNLTRCADTCDFAREIWRTSLCEEADGCLQGGERASAGNHSIEVSLALS